MLQGLTHKAGACLVLVAFMVTSLTAQNGAVIYPSAGTTLNGNPLQTSSVVTEGDLVRTDAVTAELTASGTVVLIGPRTELTFAPIMELGCGTVDVTTSKRMALRTSEVKLQPASAETTRYHVAQNGNTIDVTVQSGQLVVVDGDGTSTVTAGQSLSFPSVATCGPVNPVPAAAGKMMSKKTLAIIAGAGGGGAVAVILATRDKNPVSPSRP